MFATESYDWICMWEAGGVEKVGSRIHGYAEKRQSYT